MHAHSKEHPSHKGFFVISTIPNIAITKDGIVLNLITGNILKAVIRNHGYFSVNVKRRVSGVLVEKQFLVHRLLALAFIAVPKDLKASVGKLQVNHKDGNKLNNELSNLEWCLPKQNMQHAYANKLIGLGKNVLAMDVRTRLVKEFPSMEACAKEFGLSATDLNRHLNGSVASRRTKDWHVFKLKDDCPWPVLREIEKCENSWGITSVVLATLEDSEKFFIFESLKDFCSLTNNDYVALKNWRQRYGQTSLFKGWRLEEFSCFSDLKGEIVRNSSAKKYQKDFREFRVTSLFTKETIVVQGLDNLSEITNYSKVHLARLIRERKLMTQTHKIEILDPDDKQTGITLPRV